MPPAIRTIGAIAVVAGIGVLDTVVSSRLPFSILYFVPIMGAAWYGNRTHGLIVAIAAVAARREEHAQHDCRYRSSHHHCLREGSHTVTQAWALPKSRWSCEPMPGQPERSTIHNCALCYRQLILQRIYSGGSSPG